MAGAGYGQQRFFFARLLMEHPDGVLGSSQSVVLAMYDEDGHVYGADFRLVRYFQGAGLIAGQSLGELAKRGPTALYD